MAVEGITRPAWADIDRGALRANARAIADRLGALRRFL